MIKTKMIRKLFPFFFLLVCCILTGCGRQVEKPVEITVIHGWGSPETDHQIMRQIYADFQKVHPEIKLNIIALPSDLDVIEKMRELLTVGKTPDIVFTAGEGRDSIYQFMTEHGYALDLMPYIESDAELQKSISPLIIEEWLTDEDALYTVSDVLLMGGYWYNRTLFEQAGILEPPKTWEEFEHVCQTLERHGQTATPKIKPLLLDGDHIVYLTNVILQEASPGELYRIENSFINLKSAGFQTVLKQLKNISAYADTIDAYSFRDTLESFNQGETAMYINGVWGASFIDPAIDAAYAAFPSASGDSVSMISSGVGYILGNHADSQRTDASVEFLKYMLSESTGQRLLQETCQIPSNPHVSVSVENTGERLYQAVSCVQNADHFIEFPSNFWNYELQKKYAEAVISYLEEDLTLEQLNEKL